jgi:cobalt/nickel transport system permease protein
VSSIADGLYDLGELDRLAYQDTPIHRIDPRAKVLTTLVFIVCVVSFGKYDLIPMIPFVIFPIALASRGDVPYRVLGTRLLAAAPFAVVIGLFNPLLDRSVMGYVGSVAVTGGWISFWSIIVRFLLTVSAALVLVATTSFTGVCMALEKMGLPDILATQLLLLYRYIFVLGEEAMRMWRARALRSFGKRGMGMHVYGQMLGSLLLRTYARATRVYEAMLSRGFDGHIRVLRKLSFATRDVVFVVGWSAVFVLFRVVNIPMLIGSLVTRFF